MKTPKFLNKFEQYPCAQLLVNNVYVSGCFSVLCSIEWLYDAGRAHLGEMRNLHISKLVVMDLKSIGLSGGKPFLVKGGVKYWKRVCVHLINCL